MIWDTSTTPCTRLHRQRWWRLIWLVFGLAPLLLAWTGVSTWLARRTARKARQTSSKRAPRRRRCQEAWPRSSPVDPEMDPKLAAGVDERTTEPISRGSRAGTSRRARNIPVWRSRQAVRGALPGPGSARRGENASDLLTPGAAHASTTLPAYHHLADRHRPREPRPRSCRASVDAAATSASASTARASDARVVATGLNNPRHLAFRGGTLYVAEAGRGGLPDLPPRPRGRHRLLRRDRLDHEDRHAQDPHHHRPALDRRPGRRIVGPRALRHRQRGRVERSRSPSGPAARPRTGRPCRRRPVSSAGSSRPRTAARRGRTPSCSAIADLMRFEAKVDPDRQGADSDLTGPAPVPRPLPDHRLGRQRPAAHRRRRPDPGARDVRQPHGHQPVPAAARERPDAVGADRRGRRVPVERCSSVSSPASRSRRARRGSSGSCPATRRPSGPRV